jgi:general secretion pathway protein D
LIEDQVRESKSQVPFLGSIPILGELFKTRSVDKVKSNLMVFIRPRILRDGIDAAIESNAKYNYLRDQQMRTNKGKVPLMPTERQPTLPALETLVPPELLNPARQSSPEGETPAERMRSTSEPGPATQNPVEQVPAPTPATTPFGGEATTAPTPPAEPAPAPSPEPPPGSNP